MPTTDSGTNTEQRGWMSAGHCCCGLRWKHFLQIISQCLLPFILAVFTIVITFDQRNENRLQRLEDRRLADEQREQDLNVSSEQRGNDRWIAEEQRKHDRQIADNKLKADDLNADIQRNMTRDQRLYEIEIEKERYRREHEKYLDHLLLSYYNEMSDLLQRDPNHSLSSNSIRFSLARSKTLNVIEQIGPIRAMRLIMFLYDADQLNSHQSSLDLTEAYLNNIDLRSQRTLARINLSRTQLNGALFDGKNLSYADFRNSQLVNASFRGSICIGTRFDDALLVGADFTGANITGASFIQTNAQRAIFHQVYGQSPMFKFSRLQRTNFSDSQFYYEYFDSNGFISSNMEYSDFRRAHLIQARFVYCNLTEADFSDADLSRAKLEGSVLSRAAFARTDLGYASLFATDFSNTDLRSIKCSGSISIQSGCKLNQVWNLSNAHLPNKSIGEPPRAFLTEYDLPYCHKQVPETISPMSSLSHWKVEPPDSIGNEYRIILPELSVQIYECVFTPINTTNVIHMTRRIDLTDYSFLISVGRARAVIHRSAGYSVSITVEEIDEEGISSKRHEWITHKWIEVLKSFTRSLMITVRFVETSDKTHSWFSKFQLDIYADLNLPDSNNKDFY